MVNTRRNRKSRRNTRRNRRQNGGSASASAFADLKMAGGSPSAFQNMAGGAKIPAVGTKAQVYHGTAKHTSGGLTRKDLVKTKRGRIVSRRKQAAGRKAIKTLRKLGYIAKKGKFQLFRKGKKRGGSVSESFSDSLNDILGKLQA